VTGVIGPLLGVVSFALLLWGFIGLAVPHRIGFPSRWWAAFTITTFLPVLTLAVAIDPSANNSAPASERVEAADFLMMIAVWLVIVGFGALVRIAARRTFPEKPASDVPGIMQGALLSDEGVKLDRTPEQVDLARRAAKSEAQRREVALSDGYVTATPQPKAVVYHPPRSSSGLARPRKKSGKMARFVYVDADGVITDREIVNWRIVGPYISGYCTMRKASRDFRLDRVDEWIEYK
jgi:hypothetical protein